MIQGYSQIVLILHHSLEHVVHALQVIQEVQGTSKAQSQEESKVIRRESFDMEALGAANEGLDEDDADVKRLQEDAAMDQFKTLEKFLIYWLPETLSDEMKDQ